MRRWLLIPWGALLVWATMLAPSNLESDWLEMSRRLTLFEADPALCGLWYATGTLLFLHGTYYFAERPQHRPHPLLVLVASPLLGALLLLPYYALRTPSVREPWSWPWRLLRGLLVAELVGFVLYGVLAGDLRVLWYEITHRGFSSFLFVDCLTLAALLGYARRQPHA
jgi:RsiW-degrading membrane proteinase PrsW (M82 family)